MAEIQVGPGKRGQVLIRIVAGILTLGGLLFFPAGTLDYPEAWAFLSVLFTPVAVFSLYLLRSHPELLERRMRTRESDMRQGIIVILSGLCLFVTFLLSGLDQRNEWSSVPAWLVISADSVILLGYALFAWTLVENDYASRTVEVEENQEVVTSGPYSVVRHPMYLSVILIFGSSPLALGSFWALFTVLVFVPLILWRIHREELVLFEALPGYGQYARSVPFRLVPKVW